MLREQPRNAVPDWLAEASTDQDLPIVDMLKESLYYPACGTDGRPIQYLGGYCNSFVYADYGYPSGKITELLTADGAFFGYRLRSSRILDSGELAISQAWEMIDLDVRIDGDPRRYRDRQVKPYAFWTIFERLPDFPDDHGPDVFSLLYLAEDGVPAFQALYHSNGVAPSVVAIIQPGEGFGWNWTHFHDAKQVFCRLVMASPLGGPRYLLLGGSWYNKRFQESVAWPGYNSLVKLWKVSEGYLGLWEQRDIGN